MFRMGNEPDHRLLLVGEVADVSGTRSGADALTLRHVARMLKGLLI